MALGDLGQGAEDLGEVRPHGALGRVRIPGLHGVGNRGMLADEHSQRRRILHAQESDPIHLRLHILHDGPCSGPTCALGEQTVKRLVEGEELIDIPGAGGAALPTQVVREGGENRAGGTQGCFPRHGAFHGLTDEPGVLDSCE